MYFIITYVFTDTLFFCDLLKVFSPPASRTHTTHNDLTAGPSQQFISVVRTVLLLSSTFRHVSSVRCVRGSLPDQDTEWSEGVAGGAGRAGGCRSAYELGSGQCSVSGSSRVSAALSSGSAPNSAVGSHALYCACTTCTRLLYILATILTRYLHT